MGPHPALAQVRRAVRTSLLADRAAHLSHRVLVACSGGADSLALAVATAFEAPRAGYDAGLITIDHGLQDGSAERAGEVAALGFELGFDPVYEVRVEVGAAGGPEGAARSARYGALDRAAAALDARVLLGHTLDDQAETVLLGLGRGSGPRSIAGMRPVDGAYLRPLLGVRRDQTDAVCAAVGLRPWRDPHNDDPAFQRVRLRREVLPLLEDVLRGGVAEALARTALQLRTDLDALDGLLEPAGLAAFGAALDWLAAAQVGGPELDAAGLAALPAAVRARVLRAWSAAAGAAALTAQHTASLDELVTNWHGQGPVDLPGGRRALRTSARLRIETVADTPPN